MLVEVLFETGAEGATHSHPHEQISYCLSGGFDYSIEDRVIRLEPGDSVAVPGAVVHGTRCLSKGILIDIFTPPRKDFLA
jgi:quercetin dioxygenase-like cupin family protein